MGKNRYLPFGYRMRNGEIVIDPAEAGVIKKAFEEYEDGASYAAIAQTVQVTGIRYHTNTPEWNKNMIKRMLENDRYVGNTDYPQIVDGNLFDRVAAMRESKRIEIKQAAKPAPTFALPKEFKKPQPSITVTRMQNGVARALNMPISDPDHVKRLIFALAAERFKACLDAQNAIDSDSGSGDIVAPLK